MYQWLYHDNPYRLFPLGALFLFLAIFVGVLVWAYGPRRAKRFDHAAQLPLAEDGDER